MSDPLPLTEAELVELERQALEAAVAEARAQVAAGQWVPHEEVMRDSQVRRARILARLAEGGKHAAGG